MKAFQQSTNVMPGMRAEVARAIKGGDKVSVHWATGASGAIGNAFGYATHNNAMRKHVEPYVIFDQTARIALHIVSADHFHPIPGKVNVLFTMWEFLDVPECYIRALNKADVIIVPSTFCRDLFRRYTTKPIHVCFEGVDEKVYTYQERFAPDYAKVERFRFLWVGAPNPRKGYQYMIQAAKIIEDCPNMEVYLKTTMPKMNWEQTIKSIEKHKQEIFNPTDEKGEQMRISLKRAIERMPLPDLAEKVTVLGKHKNIFFDTRKLPTDDLVALYHSAHAFCLPTFGEGWGLTLCEAMATGCPSIATAITGCADFFDDQVGYEIDWTIMEHDLQNYDIRARGYVPKVHDVINKMLAVTRNYDKARRKGKAASERIRTKFTWKIAGQRLATILRKVQNDNRPSDN